MQKILHGFQNDMVHIVAGNEDDHLVEGPTGMGKTLVMVAATELELLRNRKVLIAAPQEHIEENFTKRDYHTIVVGGQTLKIPPERIRAARMDGASTKSVLAYLNNPDTDYALVCTHSALTRIRPPSSAVPSPLAGHVLAMDEAHHAAALGLSQFVKAWKQGAGRAWFFSACGFRNDEIMVKIPGMRVTRRTLPQHMDEGFAPKKIETSIVAIQVDDVTTKQLRGDETPLPEAHEQIIHNLLQVWQNDNRPKTVIRVPPLRGGTGKFVTGIVEAFAGIGARVLNATGQSTCDQRRFLTELRAERELCHYEQSRYDIILGIQRVVEGMDWPMCSTVYCIGLPVSIPFTIQLLGRATRRKHQQGYPAEHADRAKIVFFVPVKKGDKDTMDRIPVHHCRKALLVCSFLAHSQTGCEWAVVRHVSRGIAVPLGEPAAKPDPEAVNQVINEYPYVDPMYKGEAELVLLEAEAALAKTKVAITPANKLRWVIDHRPDANRAIVEQILVEQIVADETSTGPKKVSADRIRAKLLEAIQEHLSLGKPLRKSIENAFATVIQEMLATKDLIDNWSNGPLRRHLISLTGNQVLHFAQRLAEQRPLTLEWVLGAARKYREEYKEWPYRNSKKGVSEWPEESWRGIDDAIVKGERKWPILPSSSPTGFDLHDIVELYGDNGSIGDFLSSMLTRYRWQDARILLLRHLLAEKTRHANGKSLQTFAMAEWPMPRSTAGHPYLKSLLPTVARSWFGRFLNEYENRCGPLGILWAADLLSCIDDLMVDTEMWKTSDRWLIESSEKREITMAVKGLVVQYAVPEGCTWMIERYREEPILFQPGMRGTAILEKCGLSEDGWYDMEESLTPAHKSESPWPWNRRDNEDIPQPSWPPDVIAWLLVNKETRQPSLAAPGPRDDALLYGGNSKFLVRLPLPWITSWGCETHRPSPDWPHLLHRLRHGRFQCEGDKHFWCEVDAPASGS